LHRRRRDALRATQRAPDATQGHGAMALEWRWTQGMGRKMWTMDEK